MKPSIKASFLRIGCGYKEKLFCVLKRTLKIYEVKNIDLSTYSFRIEVDGVLLRLYMSEEELFILTHNLASAIKEAKSLFNIKLLQDIEERQLKD